MRFAVDCLAHEISGAKNPSPQPVSLADDAAGA
jgi:hypothetical protein